MATRKELGRAVIQSLVENSAGWEFYEYHAWCGAAFVVWIANRPYADLHLAGMGHGYRIGTWLQRRAIRKLMDSIIADRALFNLSTRSKLRGLTSRIAEAVQ